MPKTWKLSPLIPSDVDGRLLSYPPLLRQLLFNRGLVEPNIAEDFLHPRYENLHDPFLFQDMAKAVERIWQAINRGEKICIYGDYDADAVTANAVLRQTFKYLGHGNIESYIPDRFTEGYGVNIDALLKIKDQGSRIIITVDCGTNSVDAAEFCRENDIDLIITDHHEIIGDQPKALALINPKNRDDKYPYSEITGVAVAFKLATALLSDYNRVSKRLPSRNFSHGELSPVAKNIRPARQSFSDGGDPEIGKDLDPGSHPRPFDYAQAPLSLPNGRVHSDSAGMESTGYKGGWEKWLLDLVAIGTVADCHSLVGENRILVAYGLKVLAKTKWVGLRALMSSAGLDGTRPLDTYTLGFIIAPRLNAAGRLEHANIALDVLLETDGRRAAEKARNLEAINRRRQDLTERVLSEAREQALLLSERKILALMGEGWPKGVVGLVAGKIAEEFGKPAIVLEKSEILSTGSARTVGEFDMIEALKFAAPHLERFGGHRQAAGLSLRPENFELFYAQVLSYAENVLPPGEPERVLELEAELDGSQLSIVNCQLLHQLEPFGVDNPKPKFLVKNLTVAAARLVGQTGKHLQLQFKIGNRQIAAIYFNAPEIAKNLRMGDNVAVACEIMEDGWNGEVRVKLRVVDIKIRSTKPEIRNNN